MVLVRFFYNHSPTTQISSLSLHDALPICRLADGRREIEIRHAELRGVTPEMLDWWYGHVEGEMTYAGGTWPRYLVRSEEHTSELQSLRHLVCRLLLEKKKNNTKHTQQTYQ